MLRAWCVGAFSAVLLLAAAPASARQPLAVVATTPDLKNIAEQVSGGTIRAETLIPPGSDPESFEPRPSHLTALRQADLVLRVGAGYEHWLDRLLQQVGSKTLLPGGAGHLDLSSQIALLEVRGRSVTTVPGHAHGSANPHYWLDPANGEIMARQIADALIRLMPDRRATVEAARDSFIAELRAHMSEWIAILEPHRAVPLASYHNTWPYFARRFRLNIVDVIELKEGVAPSLARLSALSAAFRQKGVRLIIHEPFQPDATSQMLAKRVGVSVVVLAPSVGSRPEATTYIGLLDYNVRTLAKALSP